MIICSFNFAANLKDFPREVPGSPASEVQFTNERFSKTSFSALNIPFHGIYGEKNPVK